MIKHQGIAVSPGVAIGEAIVLGHEGFRIPRHYVVRDAVESELTRLHEALETAKEEITLNRETVSLELGPKYGDIFEAHLQLISDPKLNREFEELIRNKMYSAEHAVSVMIQQYADRFKRLKSSYLADRVQDIYDIEKRLLRLLLGVQREGLRNLTAPVLLLASNLTPSETANLDRRFIKGFVTELGGPGGHTAIVAAALEIPAIVGVGPFLTDVGGGDTIIIDGDSGTLILRPDEETLRHYKTKLEDSLTFAAQLDLLRFEEAITRDGTEVELLGNIEFPYEVEHCLNRGAKGIGLYRTEFLYLGGERQTFPTEEEHFSAYSEVVKEMKDAPVTIRTFDLGADKLPEYYQPTDERNPFLGLRSIRFALRNVKLFRQQLRAILRSSVYGNVRLMFPLISNLMELRQAKMVLGDVREELEEEGISYDREMLVGMMVEVPSAVVLIDRFVEEVDFISIGTNDLIQYSLAVDRSNKDVCNLFNSEDPAILRLISTTIRAADRRGIPVCLCGQMSSNPLYTMLLLGLGLRSLSCSPNLLPEIKKVCRSTSLERCREIAEEAMRMDSARDIRSLLRERLREAVPELALR